LSKINNELEKLQIILPIGSLITLKILKKISDSVKTLMSLNCGKIGERLKRTPLLKTLQTTERTGLPPSWFLVLYNSNTMDLKTIRKMSQQLGVNPYFLKEYDVAKN
jgi:DNA polymerase-3 subunit delta